ncbi:hypothetical protein JG687_00017837 [Phytophthora cactorum]|uniref:Uncharacterized protein n=1 Tax=Phytophthora cactorum TaxID=29920 RepID=A0A8T1TPB9_9STRA|nr:hypothetical protein JG687_00017837 [Phytophthora cactorum]
MNAVATQADGYMNELGVERVLIVNFVPEETIPPEEKGKYFGGVAVASCRNSQAHRSQLSSEGYRQNHISSQVGAEIDEVR